MREFVVEQDTRSAHGCRELAMLCLDRNHRSHALVMYTRQRGSWHKMGGFLHTKLHLVSFQTQLT